MAWVTGALAVACLAVAALHLVRLALLRCDLVDGSAHAAMALGMAAMFSPVGDPVPAPVWAAVFLLSGAWFAALVLRSGSPGVLGGDAAHHVAGSAAMLFMLGSGPAPADGGSPAGHAAHGGGAAGLLGLASVVAIVLAGYFAWHTLRCADRLRSARIGSPHVGSPRIGSGAGTEPGPGGPVALRRAVSLGSPRLTAGAHVAMAAAMTCMLLGMV